MEHAALINLKTRINSEINKLINSKLKQQLNFLKMTKIKKLTMLVLTVILATFSVACSDDDDTTTPQETIIGKWQLLRYGAPSEGEVEVEASECEQKSTIEFKSDGSFENIFYEEYQGCNPNTITGTWVDKGNNTIETPTFDGETRQSTYSFINGDLKVIDLDANGNEGEYNIYKKI